MQRGYTAINAGASQLPFTNDANRKVTIQQAVFDFGDDLNDLDNLEMQISYEEVELKIRFKSQE